MPRKLLIKTSSKSWPPFLERTGEHSSDLETPAEKPVDLGKFSGASAEKRSCGLQPNMEEPCIRRFSCIVICLAP
jgi:hypothetical protein